MSNLSQAEREKLPEDDFGDPAKRAYPIVDASDVDDAAHLIGKADDPEAVKRRIIAIAKRKGFALPDAWKDEGKGPEGTPAEDGATAAEERTAAPVTAAQALTEFQKAARQPQPAPPPASPAVPTPAPAPEPLTPPTDVFCIPITRIDQAKRWVEGIATSKGLDTFGTVFD